MKETIMMKIINYKGKISSKWEAPKTPKGALRTAIKFLQFYHRCKTAGLLLPDVIRVMKQVVEKFLEHYTYVVIAIPEIMILFNEIRSLKEDETIFETVEEKIRQREHARCSICGTRLVYPAYVVYRRGLEEVRRSKPVGIICLNNKVKKLQDFVKKIEIHMSGGGNTSSIFSTKEKLVSSAQDSSQLLLF